MSLVGIVAFQGDFKEHASAFEKIGVFSKQVKSVDDLVGVTHLVIPGGESSVIGRFLESSGLSAVICKKVKSKDLYVLGTCAGAILLGHSSSPYSMNLIDIELERNAYGGQLDSFSTEIKTKISKNSLEAIFIRAPIIKKVGGNVSILAYYDSVPVLCREKNIIVSTFHPELTDQSVIQIYFLSLNK